MWTRIVALIALVSCGGLPEVEGRWDLVRSVEGYVDAEDVVLDYPLEREGRTIRKAMVFSGGGVVFEDNRAGGQAADEQITDGPFPWTRDEETDEVVITGAADAMRCTVDDQVAVCTVTFVSTERADYILDQEYQRAAPM